MRKSALLVCMVSVLLSQKVSMDVVIAPKGHAPLKLMCVSTMPSPAWLNQVAQRVQTALAAPGRFDVALESATNPQVVGHIRPYAQRGYPLVVFLSVVDQKIAWRLYDALDERFINGKSVDQSVLNVAECAAMIAQQVWPELTSQPGSFTTLIAACKRTSVRRRMVQRDLCLVHPFLRFDQWAPRMLVSDGTDNVCPRWHPQKNVIFYSQHTPINVRLMSVDEHANRHVVLSLDGQSLAPAISQTTKIVALSFQGNTRLYQYAFDGSARKSSLVCLTPGEGDYVCPSFLTPTRVVFGNVDDNNRTRVGILQLPSRTISWLNVPGALDPIASPDGTRIAYSKNVAGVHQIFIYDVEAKTSHQLTHDGRHKSECSWSPCSNCLACTVQEGSSSRIGVVDTHVGTVRLITPAGQYFNCPSWSPILALPYAMGRPSIA